MEPYGTYGLVHATIPVTVAGGADASGAMFTAIPHCAPVTETWVAMPAQPSGAAYVTDSCTPGLGL